MMPKKGLALLIAGGKKSEDEGDGEDSGTEYKELFRELRLAIKDDDDDAGGEVLKSILESMGD